MTAIEDLKVAKQQYAGLRADYKNIIKSIIDNRNDRKDAREKIAELRKAAKIEKAAIKAKKPVVVKTKK